MILNQTKDIMKTKQNLEIQAVLEAIKNKQDKKEKILTSESMVQTYLKPCVRVDPSSPEARGFGPATLMLMKDSIVIMAATDDDNFYPAPELLNCAVLEGVRYPGLLSGSRLVRGRYQIRVCTKNRLKDERALARIINKWKQKAVE